MLHPSGSASLIRCLAHLGRCADTGYSVLFQFPNFVVSYESGIDEIPRFDAHLEVYSKTKQVTVQYDTPYVKGLPVTMTVRENVDGAYQERLIRNTYEDPYTLVRTAWSVCFFVRHSLIRIALQEYRELYALVTEGKPVKTTAEDAVLDLKIFQMIMRAGKPQFESH